MTRLVELARAGDAEAFAALIEARQEAMVRVAMAILGNPADASDALQDALTAMWRGLPGLREPDRFEAWADRVLVNSCRLALRRRGRRSVREVALDRPDPSQRNGHEPALDERLAARLVVERALDRLTVDQRAILVLRHLEDRAIAEIAEILRIPPGTVKSRLHHARGALERAIALERR